ncbi:hypothetical protein O181_010431 [Austropuccinia psidii MF-1]|uniref:Uncharacterized protein n=1 Tax=Austropuccinia psidii MF-1 TaxID=1389203 RepID=A0A9Q3BR10_9BASI|nr:hypothetical protein [Austropuccinia psidii MF-1]
MSPVHLRDLGFQRHQPEDRKACSEPEDLEEDTLETVVDDKTLREIIPTLPFTLQFNRNLKPEDWKDMDQVLQLHQLLKDLFQWSMDNKRFNLASHWAELGASFQKICLKEIDFRDPIVITKGWNPTRQSRFLEVRANRIRENQATTQAIEEQMGQTGHTQIRAGSQGAGQISSPVASHHSETNRSVTKGQPFTILGSFQEKTRIQGQEQDHLQPEEERVRPNYPEAIGFCERSAQEPEVVVHNSRISSPLNRNITPTKIEHNVVTPESNLNSDALWLKMSQYAGKTQKKFSEPDAIHERMKILTPSIDKIVKNLQEGHGQLSKASEETKTRLNLVFVKKHHRKRNRDCLDKDINKLFNVYHSMNPQHKAMLWIIHITKMTSNQMKWL